MGWLLHPIRTPELSAYLLPYLLKDVPSTFTRIRHAMEVVLKQVHDGRCLIVREVIQNHHWHIWAECEPEQRTTFEVMLPT